MLHQQYRPLLLALYPVGMLLLFASASEPLLQIWPLRFDNTAWRFGAAGLFSGVAVGTVFVLAWTMAIAAVLEHQRVIRVCAVLSGALALAVSGGMVLFTLDFLQLRGSLNPELKASVDITVLRAMVMLTVSIGVALGLGWGGWRSARATRRRANGPVRDERLVLATMPQGGE